VDHLSAAPWRLQLQGRKQPHCAGVELLEGQLDLLVARQAASAGRATRTYRVYFLDDLFIGQFDFQADDRCYFLDDHMIGQFDFLADDGARAVQIAEILFDACSDRCRSWQIWGWGVFLVSGP
jgi:hypothetical protein